jgi:Cysteine-rich secretory protein family
MPVALDIPATETAIVQMTNTFRAEHRLAGVTPNPLLAAAARAYAKVLAARQGELSHTIDGTTPATRVNAAGYGYCQIGENLAVAYDSRGFTAGYYARLTLDGWKESPGHRRNLLMPEVTDIGVAVARSGANDPRYVAVQLFARPRALKYTFKIANRTTRTVDYTFAGEEHEVLPRQIITHTSCAAGDIAFKLEPASAGGRYEARDGRVYTLKPRPGGGVNVQVGGGGTTP